MRVLAGLLISLFHNSCEVLLVYDDLQGYQSDA